MPEECLPDHLKGKKCRKCLATKTLSLFYTRKNSTLGMNAWCKDCCNAYKRAWRIRKTNPLVRKCSWCGTEFIVSRKRRTACNPKCRYQSWFRDVYRIKNQLKPKPEFVERRYIDEMGYIAVRKNGVLEREHVIVAEMALGRPLKKGEVVHHINGIKTDNRNFNLIVCTSKYHKEIHQRMGALYQKEHFNA